MKLFCLLHCRDDYMNGHYCMALNFTYLTCQWNPPDIIVMKHCFWNATIFTWYFILKNCFKPVIWVTYERLQSLSLCMLTSHWEWSFKANAFGGLLSSPTLFCFVSEACSSKAHRKQTWIRATLCWSHCVGLFSWEKNCNIFNKMRHSLGIN